MKPLRSKSNPVSEKTSRLGKSGSGEEPASSRKPILIYDGDCNFCRHWVEGWKHVTEDKVDYAASQAVADLYPQIPWEHFERSVQLVEPDGSVYEGADAVFRTLAYAPQKKWPLWLYRRVPGFAPASERVYRFVADHRMGFRRITRFLWGEEFERPTYFLTRRLFLFLLGLIYFIAFVSMGVQIKGLVGTEGILPAQEFLDAVRQNVGGERYWRFPTLFWLGAGDAALVGLCGAGAVLSGILMAGRFPALVLALLWLFYLSLLTVSRQFMAFQWDILLLEMGFLALFLAPFRMRPRLDTEPAPSPVLIWLYRFLLFRVMFSSGMVKLLSEDESWRNLTAIGFHYETQPLPTWIAWFAHQLPQGFQEFSAGCVFVLQLVVPFFIFAPKRFRRGVFWIMVLFQVLILLTGNYGFFNFLMIVLSLLLLDDGYLRKFLPRRWTPPIPNVIARPREPRGKKWAVAALTAGVLLISGTFHLGPFFVRHLEPPEALVRFYASIRSFHSLNPYGLFAVMTTRRPEIILEGSHDGRTWKAYEFKWKPGDVSRAPAFVAPHMPRLDWQMWFAALGDYPNNPWFLQFMKRLLQGSEEVLGLLEINPFPDRPPRYLRAVVYNYRYTDLETWHKTGAWWEREKIGLYAPVLKLPG